MPSGYNTRPPVGAYVTGFRTNCLLVISRGLRKVRETDSHPPDVVEACYQYPRNVALLALGALSVLTVSSNAFHLYADVTGDCEVS
jgi:hypothetical protein